MPKKTVEKYRQAAKGLRRYLDSPQYRARPPERAFVEWYILARFGQLTEAKISDGKKDGGIDAVVENSGRLFVLQSRYEVVPRASLVTRSEIADFEKTTSRFRDATAQADFLAWLGTVRANLHASYKNIRKRAIEKPDTVRFIFVTTKRFNLDPGEMVEVEDVQNVSSLWYLYSEGYTPPTEHIELDLESAWHTSSEEDDFKTYVGLADVKDFLHLMDDDKNERLFAQNVRTDLRSQINQAIRTTYEQDPERFWLGNNGIYIVCKKVIPSGRRYRLTYPSIINGSQTLHSIYSSRRSHSCAILVRILEMDVAGNPGLLSDVIRRTNTQNPMKLINLSAHDFFQLNIARYLDRYKIFYERREKEWVNEKKAALLDYYPINMKDMAQWLATSHSDIGFGRARSRVSDLFQTKLYKRVFGGFDKELKSRKYSELAEVGWAGLVVRNLLDYLPARRRVFAKISQLLLVRALYDASRTDRDLQRAIESMLAAHRFGRKYIPTGLRRPMKDIVAGFVRLQASAQERDPNIDFSNFFKRDDLSRQAYRKICTRKMVKRVWRALRDHIDGVK